MAQIQKGTTYITGDQVTAANLNALADSAILLAGAITDQTAKTVPLAADTVLIHSAADTALRKSTLTQVFANATGIPISTGISGLGTGVATALAVNVGTAGAPVVNGGALGTPTSGTVTNLTGTASININGTVGATTPSTVAATTIKTSSTASIGTTAVNEIVNIDNATGNAFVRFDKSGTFQGLIGIAQTAGQGSSGSAVGDIIVRSQTNSLIDVAGTTVGKFTTTGLNSTAIGATTASTGSFTTLGASGTVSQTPNAGDPSYKLELVSAYNGADSFRLKFAGTTYLRVNTNDGVLLAPSSLAVTGALSSTTGANFATSSGNVGIGTASPAGKLQVTGSSASFILNTAGTEFYNTNAGTVKIYASNAAGALALSAGGRDAGDLFINSTGNVGIGTTSPAFPLDVNLGLVVRGNATRSGSGMFLANDSTYGLSINAVNHLVAGLPLAIMGYPIKFLSSETGGELARIDTSGNLLVGTTSAGGKLVVTQGASSTNAILVDIASSTTKFAEFTFTGSNVGSISYNGTNTVYSTTSDYRLKDITGPLVDSGSFIDALKPKVGTWKSNGSKFVGFLAHEFAEVSPSSVCGEMDAVDSDGKPVHQTMQAGTAEVIANLVAELQSVRARLAALESK